MKSDLPAPSGLLKYGIYICMIFVGFETSAQSLDVGLRFQKTLDMYLENGVTVQYRHPKLWQNNLRVGVTYVSSRLGSAIGTNAVWQDNVFLSGNYLFRHEKIFRPFLGVNAGWFNADYGSDIFRDLPHSTPIVSAEAGISFYTRKSLQFGAGIGYNFITGNGVDVPGTLFPVFAQLNVTYNLLKSRSK